MSEEYYMGFSKEYIHPWGAEEENVDNASGQCDYLQGTLALNQFDLNVDAYKENKPYRITIRFNLLKD